jgi:hypothetical protein
LIHHNSYLGKTILVMKELSFNEAKYLDQDPPTNKWKNQELNPGLSLFTFLYYLLSGNISNFQQDA